MDVGTEKELKDSIQRSKVSILQSVFIIIASLTAIIYFSIGIFKEVLILIEKFS